MDPPRVAEADRQTSSAIEIASWRTGQALGLPAGSVRALVALIVFSTIWGFLLLRPDLEVPEFLRDLLFIVMGHYFAVRAQARQQQQEGPPPLYLPRGTIRAVALLGFVAVGFLILRDTDLETARRLPATMTLVLVGGFLLGVLAKVLSGWLFSGNRHPPRWIEDAKAIGVLAASTLLAILVWNSLSPFLPDGLMPLIRSSPLSVEAICASVIGFYFGTRS